jgi:hypothetical protein
MSAQPWTRSTSRARRPIVCALSFFGPGGVLPVVLATAHGYRIVPRGNYATVKGNRFLGPGILAAYLRTGRVPGVRYRIDNPKVSKFLSTDAAARNAAREALDVRNPGFWRAARKGGGPLGLSLTLGSDVYDFTAGGHKSKGLASTDFAATAAVDTSLLAGSTVAGAAAATATTSLLAGGATGAAAGSFAPGIGTAVGFGVGIGITFLMTTEPGRQVRGQMISGTKAALDWVKDHPAAAARVAANPAMAPAHVAWEFRDEIGDAASGVARAGAHEIEKAGKGIVEGITGGFRGLGRLRFP